MHILAYGLLYEPPTFADDERIETCSTTRVHTTCTHGFPSSRDIGCYDVCVHYATTPIQPVTLSIISIYTNLQRIYMTFP